MLIRSLCLVSAAAIACAAGCNSSPGATSSPTTARTPAELAEGSPGPTATPKHPLPDVPAAEPREQIIARLVRELLQSEHLDARPIDDTISERACARFIEALDPGKMFLLQWQVDALMHHARQLDDELEAGDLKLARLGHALLSEQRKVVAGIVASTLQQPFDLTRVEEIETDADKRSFAKDADELRDVWRRNLKLQVLERIAGMRRASEAKAEAEKQKEEEAKEATEGAAGKGKGKGRGKGKDKKDGPAAVAEKGAADGSEGAEADPTVVEELLPDTDEGREKKARTDMATRYEGRFKRLATPKPLEAVETFVNAITAVFDPHTQYLAPDDKANFDIQMSGSLEGIGAVLSEDDHYIEVREVIPGGAAWRQGELEAGDLIMAVQQASAEAVDIGDMRLSEVVKMIRGPKGTRVSLTVRKPDDRMHTIEITRDVIVVEASYARGALLDLGEGYEPVGYVFLPSFYGNTRSVRGATAERRAVDDVRALLQRFASKRVTGVVLDLRGNGGGLLAAAKDITGLFIEKGPVVQAGASGGRRQVLQDTDARVYFEGDLIVMVDRFSASASEILAGALQDYGRALVVGTGPTHGKGTVQTLVGLDRMVRHQSASLGVLKLTVQQYFLVDGESTQLRGVRPDIVLPDPASYVESSERNLDNAIPWSSVKPLPHTPWKGPRPDVAALDAASAERRGKERVFAIIEARSAHLEARKKDTRIPLETTAFEARRANDDEKLEALDPKLDEAPARFEVAVLEYRPERASKQPGSRSDEANEAADARIEQWREGLSHDPWIAEALHLLHDMQRARDGQTAQR